MTGGCQVVLCAEVQLKAQPSFKNHRHTIFYRVRCTCISHDNVICLLNHSFAVNRISKAQNIHANWDKGGGNKSVAQELLDARICGQLHYAILSLSEVSMLRCL